MDYLWQKFWDLMNHGGPAMWVLLAINVLSLTVLFERCWFWIRTNHPGRLQRLARINRLLLREWAVKSLASYA